MKGHPGRMMIRCAVCGSWFEQRNRRGNDAHTCCSRTCGFVYQKGRPRPGARKPPKKDEPKRCKDCGEVIDRIPMIVLCRVCRERRERESSKRFYEKSKVDGSYQRELRRKGLEYAAQHMTDVTCRVCGAVFLGYEGRHCSDRCSKMAAQDTEHEQKARRRARKKEAFIERVSRLKVFQRDGWVCHLCGKRIHKRKKAPHPMSATIDHIVPLCCGGEHRMSNVATAHFICNSKKSGKIIGQLRLAI